MEQIKSLFKQVKDSKKIQLILGIIFLIIVLVSGSIFYALNRSNNSKISSSPINETQIQSEVTSTQTPTPAQEITITPTEVVPTTATTIQPSVTSTNTPTVIKTATPTIIKTPIPTSQPTTQPIIQPEPAPTNKTYTITAAAGEIANYRIQIPTNWTATQSYTKNCGLADGCYYIKVTGTDGEILEFNFGYLNNPEKLPLSGAQTGTIVKPRILISLYGTEDISFMQTVNTKSNATGVTNVYYNNGSQFAIAIPAQCGCIPNAYIAARGKSATGKVLSQASQKTFNDIMTSFNQIY